METEEKTKWWGAYTLAQDFAGKWFVGPSTLWIYRSMQSWHLFHTESEDAMYDSAAIDLPRPIAETDLSLEEPPEGATVTRYGFQKTDSSLSLAPMLADRAIVVRPDIPLFVLAGEEVTLYVSTPLWIRVEVGSDGRLLQEIPSYRPSDTWFGSSPAPPPQESGPQPTVCRSPGF